MTNFPFRLVLPAHSLCCSLHCTGTDNQKWVPGWSSSRSFPVPAIWAWPENELRSPDPVFLKIKFPNCERQAGIPWKRVGTMTNQSHEHCKITGSKSYGIAEEGQSRKGNRPDRPDRQRYAKIQTFHPREKWAWPGGLGPHSFEMLSKYILCNKLLDILFVVLQ